jgi:hypothetical protein
MAESGERLYDTSRTVEERSDGLGPPRPQCALEACADDPVRHRRTLIA